MKIRTDYVTNSSSSSFIVGFKDENSVEQELRKEIYLGAKFDTVLNDIKRNRITKEKALDEFKDEMYWDARYVLRDEFERKLGWHDYYGWIKNPDNKTKFETAVNKRLDVWLEEFKQKIDGLDYLALVEYDDHCNSDLEHNIMPSLECTIQRFSHH